jgi:hypothetical protein
MLALGHYGPEGQAMNRSGLIAETCGDENHLSSGHPEIHAALTSAAVFREHSRAFVNLSMHEQRLFRMLTAASKSLEELKAKRIAARQADLDTAVALHNLNKMQGVPYEPPTSGFVFKPGNRDRMPPSSPSSGSQNRPGMPLRQEKVPPTRRRSPHERLMPFLQLYLCVFAPL